MKSELLFLQELLHEMGQRCRISTSQDLRTILARYKHEGDSFLTITLPTFGKDVERCLELGYVDHALFQGFTWRGGLPELFRGFLDQVFDRKTGRLLLDPSIDAILCLRQACLMWAKMEIPCSDARNKSAIDKYMECESDVNRYNNADPTRSPSWDDFRRIGVTLFSSAFTEIDYTVNYGIYGPPSERLGVHLMGRVERSQYGDRPSFRGKHGPGATADRLRGNRKYSLASNSWHRRLEHIFPYGDYGLSSYSFLTIPGCESDMEGQGIRHEPRDPVQSDLPGMEFSNPRMDSEAQPSLHFPSDGLDELPVRVITVPKTLKTPRIIAIEPTAVQFMQQAVLEQIVYEVNRDKLLRNLIGFDDQTPNQRLARKGSISGTLATLDLSEASDRVSNLHVQALLSNHPNFAEGVEATRTRKADVPHYGIIPLAKFASMGSALCFPFEAMVFLTLVILGIERKLNRQLTRRDLFGLIGKVRVYGDDIIVPTDYVRSVITTLEEFNFRVNGAKSFWTGKFRESCGKDYYDGRDVSITRVRKYFPTSRTHVDQIISIVSLRNQLFTAGYESTVDWLDAYIKRFIPFPYVSQTSDVLGRYRYEGYQADRWHPHLQRPLVYGAVVRARLPVSRLDGEFALQKFFLKRGEKPLDKDHLLRAGRPDSLSLKIGWTFSD